MVILIPEFYRLFDIQISFVQAAECWSIRDFNNQFQFHEITSIDIVIVSTY